MVSQFLQEASQYDKTDSINNIVLEAILKNTEPTIWKRQKSMTGMHYGPQRWECTPKQFNIISNQSPLLKTYLEQTTCTILTPFGAWQTVCIY